MTTPGPPTSPARTKGGELRAKVAQLLADRSADALTIGHMARQLGHSHGAVRNAALTLVRRGEADQGGSGQPEFRANAKTAAAAQTAVISPRAPTLPASRRPRPARPFPPQPARPSRAARSAARGSALPPTGAGRSARRRGAEPPARRRRAGAALRPSGHRQDESGRGGVPGPAHRRRGRRHHGRRLGRRVHTGRQRRLRLPVRSAGHRDDRGPRPADRRRHLDLAEGPGGAVSRDGRAQADPGQGPQGRDHQGRAGLLCGGRS